jgi:thioredoxin reductase (NADPH)
MSETSPEKVQLLIIGSGAAGYTAAIYAARANLKPVLYQGIQPGGQLTITTAVENYPGFSEGIQGPELMMEFEKQAGRMGADIRYGYASKVDFSKRPFKVWIDEEKLIEADAVIISTGASAKWLGLESERRLTGHGVGSCAVCDGFFFRGKDVAIVGGGDTAAQDALYLSKIVRNVHMIVRRDKMRASAIMQDRVKATPNITIHWNSVIGDVLGENKVNGVLIHNKNRESATLPVEGLFVAIGFQPNTDIFNGFIDMDEIGYLKTIHGTSRTNIEGVFAAGDVQDSIYRQAITAAGSGCVAALDAERYLSLQEHELTNRLAVASEQKPAA